MERNVYSFLICCIIILLLISCDKAKTLETPIKNEKLIIELLDKTNKGDTLAYNEVFHYYYLESLPNKILSYSLYMANKYNYPKAYYNVYISLSKPRTGEQLGSLDNRTKCLAMFYPCCRAIVSRGNI